MKRVLSRMAVAWALSVPVAVCAAPQAYRLGVGMSDITGEAAEVGMMGYALLEQKTAGIHQRLRARAFIVQDEATQRSAVVVITDGIDTSSQQTADSVVARSRALDVPIYTVSVVSPLDDPASDRCRAARSPFARH